MKEKKTQQTYGRGRRFLKLARLSASAATKYAGNRVKRVFQDETDSQKSQSKLYDSLGQDMANTLGELKGAVMKVGQIASQAQGILPDEVINALAVLQKDAPPMSFEVIAKQIETALEGQVEILFASIDPEPYAAASIGQVHRASLHDGTQVVVKIQYPGVNKSVHSDIAQLRMLLTASRLIKVDKKIADAYFEEIKAHILEELDYENEAKNLKEFRRYHLRHDKKLIIPEVVSELSSKTVLTMIYEPGDHIADLQKANYSVETINQLGHRIFDTVAREIFHFGKLHADPHPGNFAFRPDGTLVMYDFGSIKKLDMRIVKAYKSMIKAAIAKDYQSLDDTLFELGARIANSPPLGDDFYALWVDIFLQPFASDAAYDFAQSTIQQQMKENMAEVLKKMDSLQPVVGMAYIERAISGHFNNLVKMGVNTSFKRKLLAVLEK